MGYSTVMNLISQVSLLLAKSMTYPIANWVLGFSTFVIKLVPSIEKEEREHKIKKKTHYLINLLYGQRR